MNETNLEREARLLDVLGAEIAAVVDVELLGNTADGPVRIGLAPDRLPEGEGRVHGARGGSRQEEAGDGPAVVVHDDRQPWTNRDPAVAEHEDIENCMVSLPHLIGCGGVASMYEFVQITVRRSIRRDRDAGRLDPAHDPGHGRIAGSIEAPRFHLGPDLAIDSCRSWPGAPGRHVPHMGFDIGRELARLSGVAAPCPFQSLNAVHSPGREPAAQGALSNAAFSCDMG